MKKTLISIVVLSMAIISLALTACSDKKDSSSGSGTAKESVKKNEKSNGKANPESDFKVELNDDGTGIRILQYIGTSPNVIIPETIQGMTVLEVKPSFCINEEWMDSSGNKYRGNKTVKKIVFPDTITEFSGEYTERLGDLIALEYVKLPKHLKNKTYNKVSMIGPNEVTNEEPISFGGCIKLKEIIIPDEVEFEVMPYFGGCTSLKSIKIPASVNHFTNTFWGCSSLNEIIFPESATSYEFEGLRVFEETNLPIATQAKIKQFGYEYSF